MRDNPGQTFMKAVAIVSVFAHRAHCIGFLSARIRMKLPVTEALQALLDSVRGTIIERNVEFKAEIVAHRRRAECTTIPNAPWNA
jgi:hypothetical protein